MSETAVVIDYTNYRGERALRPIEPARIVFGATPWHPEKQWLLEAFDIVKNEHRSFALAGVPGWFTPNLATVEASLAKQLQGSMERNARMVTRLKKLRERLNVDDDVNAASVVALDCILKDEEPTW